MPFLHAVFARLHEERPLQSVLDPFAGSGAVARLAKWMGFSVHANDWEHYAYLLNHAFVALDRSRAESLFRAEGGLDGLLRHLNSLHGDPAQPYISRHYAPASTDSADYRTERLFYSRENALFIDRVREEIERLYPEEPENPRRFDQRALLLALLLYEAATHANTSGVFKAYHKGFGGHGSDALGRILAPMELELPQLIDGRRDCSAGMQDAALCGGCYDLAYLDPPYNQHQYGSNYFMLNSIALWDRPPIDGSRDRDGALRIKAGIRVDWIRTRSAYCSRPRASAEFERLLDRIDAPRLVVSYNAQGVIELEHLIEICSRHGEVEIDGTDYVRYRGGRQSLTRKSGNHEFVLIVRRGVGAAQAADSARFLLRRAVSELCGRLFCPDRLRAVAEITERGSDNGRGFTGRFVIGGRPLILNFDALLRLDEPLQQQLGDYDAAALEALRSVLESAVCRDNAEQAEILLQRLRQNSLGARDRQRAVRLFAVCLRKLAHRKYRRLFEDLCRRAAAHARDAPQKFPGLGAEIEALRRLAARRFDG